MTSFESARKFAITFAEKVTRGNFSDARQCFIDDLKRSTTTEAMKKSYSQMVNYENSNGTDLPNDVEITIGYEMKPEELHHRKENDVGWFYVAITNDYFNEAVTLTVCNDLGDLKVREISWGRP